MFVVGAPIDVEQVDEPTSQQINDLHGKYVQALVELFENNKGKYGAGENDHLNVM